MNKSLLNQFVIIGVLICLLFAGARWLTRSLAQPRTNDESLVTVTTILPKNLSVSKTISFSGPIVGRTEVPVYAEIAQGRISNVLVEEGQHVKAGQVLATVDTSLLDIQKSAAVAKKQKASAAVAQQEAMLEEADIQYKEAASLKERGDNVAKSGFISSEIAQQRDFAEQAAAARLKSARNALEIARADYADQLAQLSESQLYVNKASIKTNVSGTIIDRKAIIGQVLNQINEPLFVILHNDTVEVELEASSNEINRLQAGVPAKIQVIGDEKNYDGEIRLSAAKINRSNQMGKLRVRFINAPKAIPGQYARVSVSLKPRNGLYIPDKAIRLENGLASVFTVKDGMATQLPVILGDRTGDMVEILEGLTTDTPIIDGFAAFIRAGEHVRVLDSTASKQDDVQKADTPKK